MTGRFTASVTQTILVTGKLTVTMTVMVTTPVTEMLYSTLTMPAIATLMVTETVSAAAMVPVVAISNGFKAPTVAILATVILTGGSNAEVNGIRDGNADVYKNGICVCNGNASGNAPIHTLHSLPIQYELLRPESVMVMVTFTKTVYVSVTAMHLVMLPFAHYIPSVSNMNSFAPPSSPFPFAFPTVCFMPSNEFQTKSEMSNISTHRRRLQQNQQQ